LFLIPFITIVASVIILYPNFSERTLVLTIHPEVATMTPDQRTQLLSDFQRRWSTEYNTDNKWSIEPSPSNGIPSENQFKVVGRFITAAKINQISQENPLLFIESKNKLMPSWIEETLRGGRSMAIKLGLDLQGGIRVVLKGDFEAYQSKMKDLFAKEISDNEAILNDLSQPPEKIQEAKRRMEDIRATLELNPTKKQIELEKAKLIIDNRLTNQNLTEPQVRIQRDQDSIEVSLPGVSNSSQILEILQNTETVEYRLQEPAPYTYQNRINEADRALLIQGKRENTDIVQFQKLIKERSSKKVQDQFLAALEDKYQIPKNNYKLYAYWARGDKPNSPLMPRSFMVLERGVSLSGNDLTNASPNFNPNSYSWVVSFSLTPQGTEKFFEITSQNRGRNLAVIWGDKVLSNPTINDPIAGGRAEISGSFSQEEAVRLANVISEGALPIPLSVLEMRFIGPTLGIESIEVGVKSVWIGFCLVIFYMMLYYRLAGIVADLALLINVLVLGALLSLMDFTLTLPGFAGVILTVGMAVDANVIIYERIKEELHAGKHITTAVTKGFENAFWTIVDSNITTLISGILMIRLGNGPIKGFAITLCWGIITSLFTSLFLSRIILEFMVYRMGVKSLGIGFSFIPKIKKEKI
jgi:preprotein translocase subunit SecD